MPVKNKEKKFLPILKTNGKIPWGYKESDDPNLFEPIVEELTYLEHAKTHLLEHYGYKKTAEWLTKISGKYISRRSLHRRLAIEEKNASKEKYYKKICENLEKAKKNYETYSHRIGGTSSYIWQ